MFGRRKREAAAAEAARREAERRVLLEQLAQRPDSVCPFLGLERDRAGYHDGADPAHRCYAFGDPAVLSDVQQTRVCLQRGYGNCPRYLRGVLVIPTEELEALRRPAPPRAETPAASPPRRRRFAWVGVLALFLLIGGGGAAAWAFLGGGLAGVADASPSPTPTSMPASPLTSEPATPEPATPTASPEPTPSPEPSPDRTPVPATPTPLPTAGSEDVFAHYEVGVSPSRYVLYFVDGDSITSEAQATFSDFSHARVEPQQLADGRVAWVTQNGFYAGYAYIAPSSGSFEIRAVFRAPDGELHADVLAEDELTVMPEGTPAP